MPSPQSTALVSLLAADAEPVFWWASPVECQSALHRRHRDGQLPTSQLEQALRRLAGLIEDADIVAPTARLRERAGRLLASHALRAADALQLAAALAWCEDSPADEGFVCLDERLRSAAHREGFALRPA